MVGREDGKTRGHAAHWERRRAGADRGEGGGLGGGRVKGLGSIRERRNKAEKQGGERERKRGREGYKERREKEVTGRGRMNFRVSFYRKLQRDNSRLVPIHFMALMIPTERHKSRVELNQSEGAADSKEGGGLLRLASTRT